MKRTKLAICALVAIAPLPALARNNIRIVTHLWDNMTCTVYYNNDVMRSWTCRGAMPR